MIHEAIVVGIFTGLLVYIGIQLTEIRKILEVKK